MHIASVRYDSKNECYSGKVGNYDNIFMVKLEKDEI